MNATTTIHTDPHGNECPWPTSEGYWMGFLNDHWFPLETMRVKDDLPIINIDAHTQASAQVGMPIVARFPKTRGDWPFIFKGNHPVNRWRLPTETEADQIRHFYSLPPIS